jgi:uncharacterized membrane protein
MEPSLAGENASWSNQPGRDRADAGRSSCCGVNVGSYERLASLFAGTTLAGYGLFQSQRGRLPLATLGAALVYRGLTGRCMTYAALGVSTADKHNDATVIPAKQGVKVEKTITVNRPASELYGFWREVENLPKVMRHLKRVDAIDRTRSHWVAEALGKEVEWDAEIFNDRENEAIAWRSLPGGDVDTAGSVHFKPLGQTQATQMTVSLKFDPPAGKVAAWLADLLGDGLEDKVADDLCNFKRFMEIGENASRAGEPAGRVGQ